MTEKTKSNLAVAAIIVFMCTLNYWQYGFGTTEAIAHNALAVAVVALVMTMNGRE